MLSVVAYESAVSAQDHSAYTDYLFAMRAKNDERRRAGEAQESILTKNEWLKQIETPRREYAEYYDAYLQSKRPAAEIVPFEHFTEADYKKFKSEQFAEMRKKARSQHTKIDN